MFKRKIYGEIKAWKDQSNGNYALMIEGPRRVGKSTIIEEFVKNEYKSYILIKFEETGEDIKRLFDNLSDLDRFFLLLQQYTKTRLYNRESAIVFDEVQLFPLARQSIKTLVEDGRYDYYETGSLISIKKNVKNILIPSEEDSIYMHPMDFEEFLWATGDEMTMPFIRESFNDRKPIGDVMHNRIMETYRTYMLVGGFPKAVSTFIDNNSFASAEKVKKSILDLYMKDAAKLDSDNISNKARAVLNALPSNLEKHDKTFSPGLVDRGSGMREIRRTISELEDSMMVNICYRSTEPAIDQENHSDHNDLKMYLCDTGLLFTQSFSVLMEDSDAIYRSMLNGEVQINNGMYFENMVAQELVMTGHKLFFSKFEHEGAEKLQEVDFIIVKNREPTAVEVKSGKRPRNHMSLDRFLDKFGDRVNTSYVVCTKDLQVCNNITYIPIYMAALL